MEYCLVLHCSTRLDCIRLRVTMTAAVNLVFLSLSSVRRVYLRQEKEKKKKKKKETKTDEVGGVGLVGAVTAQQQRITTAAAAAAM